MKKLLSMFLMFTFLFTLGIPVSAYTKADQKIKLEEAIDTAKTKLGIKTENYNFNYNYNENREGTSAYELSWNAKKGNGNISVSVNSETGEIINYNQWSQNTTAPSVKIPKYSKEQALKAAKEFIQKLAGEKFQQTILSEQKNASYDMPIYSDSYNFSFVRKVNGLAFQDNGFGINLDKNTLQVRNYNMNWDNVTFTDPSKAISSDAAKKVFAEKLGIELAYQLVYDEKSKTQTPILVYSYANGNNPIDAVTGEIIKNGFYGLRNADMMATSEKAAGYSLTPEEQISVDVSNKYVSKDIAVAEAKKYVSIDDSFKFTQSSLYANSMDQSANWNFSWEKNDTVSKSYSYFSATVNAVTGKINSFNMNGNEFYPEKETAVTYTKDQAKKMAEEFIQKLEPENFKLTVYKDDSYNTPIQDKVSEYSFRYVAMINGATCGFDNFNISVNAYSGKIMSYSKEWKDVKLPATEGALTLENAYKALYAKASLTLKYIRNYNYSGIKTPSLEIKLAYVLDGFSGLFDAKTGTFLDYNGTPIIDKKIVSFTDIKGDAAENDINILIDLGVIDSQESKFSPKNAILQKDFIKLLAKTISPSYSNYAPTKAEEGAATEYDAFYQLAMDRNIIKQAQIMPDAKVTKLEAIKLVIRAMSIGYIAESSDTFALQYKDASKIPAAYKGYVALAAGLGIVKSGAISFDGNTSLSNGQTATMLVNYMKVDLNK